jgi:AcrR family transcriptional regulator
VPRAVREQQLLEVAKGLFGTEGYEGTSIEDIARAAGVTRPVVYDHFGSKDGIYLACVRLARKELELMIIEAARGKNDPGEQLWGGINAYFEFVERNLPSWDVLFGRGVAPAGPAAEELMRARFATVSRIAELIANAAPNVDAVTVEAFAHALSGSGELLAKWWREHPDISREQIAGYHMAFAWLGLERLVAGAQDLPPAGGDDSPPVTG